MCDKNCVKYTLLIILSSFVLLFLFFKFGPKIPLSIVTQEKGQPLMVEGTGKVAVVPNIAKVTVGITDSGATLSGVQKNVNTKSKTLTDALKKLGIGESDIKTVSYNVYPQYNYNVTPQTITGYQVSTSYEITVKNIDKINDVVGTATSSGANTVGGISFDLNDDTKNQKLNEAREAAVKEAKAKAEGLAKAAGISLGKILNISEFQGTSARPVPIYTSKDNAVGLESTPVPADINPGETEISVTVSLSYEIR